MLGCWGLLLGILPKICGLFWGIRLLLSRTKTKGYLSYFFSRSSLVYLWGEYWHWAVPLLMVRQFPSTFPLLRVYKINCFIKSFFFFFPIFIFFYEKWNSYFLVSIYYFDSTYFWRISFSSFLKIVYRSSYCFSIYSVYFLSSSVFAIFTRRLTECWDFSIVSKWW